MGKHSIIVIKNQNNEYLQCFEKNWNSYLFPNCKMENSKNIDVIIHKIARDLSVDESKIHCQFIGQKTHKKFSESAKIEKEYIHYFYNVTINKDFPNKEFKLNNIQYKWFSYEELIKDKRIQEVNNDIVSFIKDLNI